MNSNDRLIVGLDVTHERAIELAKMLPDGVMVKVGLKLFYEVGPDVVRELQSHGMKIFLDLKFHDIPNQVADACEVACNLGVSMFNLHALGGKNNIAAARERINAWAETTGKPKPILLGVTVLTSMDKEQLEGIGITSDVDTSVLRLAKLALENGCDGIVCSAKDLPKLRTELGKEFIAVTPGIRRATDDAGDQKRIVTPEQAIRNGASHIVVGRPIYNSPNPAEEARAILEEMNNVK